MTTPLWATGTVLVAVLGIVYELLAAGLGKKPWPEAVSEMWKLVALIFLRRGVTKVERKVDTAAEEASS